MNTFTDYIRIAALPLDIKWGDKKVNCEAVARACEDMPAGTDILVLPELFSTGYADDPDAMNELAEPSDGAAMTFVKELAERRSMAVAGSFLAKEAGKLYNRGFFVEPNGDTAFYDKHHLFSISSEAKIMSAGVERMPVVRFRGWNVSMIICYDLRFPVWCRCHKNEYDLLLIPANWPQARGYAFTHLAIARAIENQCSVVAADRGGSDAYGEYDGLTQIFDSRGMPVGKQIGGFIVADLSRKKQDAYRAGFPAANDADDFRL